MILVVLSLIGRGRLSDKDNEGKPLVKHIRNSKQKTMASEQAMEWASQHNLQALKGTLARAKARQKTRYAEFKNYHVKQMQRKTKRKRDEEDEEYFAEKVLDHGLSRERGYKGFMYLVRWRDHDSDDDTWEPEPELRTDDGEPIDVLADYLRQIGELEEDDAEVDEAEE